MNLHRNNDEIITKNYIINKYINIFKQYSYLSHNKKTQITINRYCNNKYNVNLVNTNANYIIVLFTKVQIYASNFEPYFYEINTTNQLSDDNINRIIPNIILNHTYLKKSIVLIPKDQTEYINILKTFLEFKEELKCLEN